MKHGQLTENFHIDEFECRDGVPVPCGLILNCLELAQNLQVIRDRVGPLRVTSGFRTPMYNATLPGAAKNSQHLYAKAADLQSDTYSPKELHRIILELISEGKIKNGGLALYTSFVHYDVRQNPARWGK